MLKTCVLITTILASTVVAGFELTWSTIDGGGAMNATGGNFSLSGTIGQPDAGLMSGGNYTLVGGFWGVGSCHGNVPVDFDHDCDVDFADLSYLSSCAAGPAGAIPPACSNADLDSDGDTDQVEFGVWQRCFSGDNLPANPICAD